MIEGNGFDTAEAGPSGWSSIHDGYTPSEVEDDVQEILHEQEAEELENNLTRYSETTSHTPSAHRRTTSLAPLHTSASELFHALTAPSMSRQTTYSSLPPSPREAHVDLDFGRHGLGIRELEQLGEDDRFWPALSRRNTFEGERARARTPEPEVEAEGDKAEEGMSIWELLRDEVGAEEWDGWIVEGKWERIANFLAVPLAVEKVTLFGALLCLDGFLYNFTILPIRALYASVRFLRRPFAPIPRPHLHSILRMLLLLIPTAILLVSTDSSKMYHTVRGQDTIKLYVIFNALEIADRLCCAFGQDVLDTLFARETTKKVGKGRKRQQARPVFFFALSLGYVLTHSLIFFYMLVSLNVAINSYDYTLLSLLISNQFVEIKGSVFKKFEKENLFQIMCAGEYAICSSISGLITTASDIVERFQLSLMLSVIALRNLIEMAGSEIAFLPKSFIRGKSLLETILSPVLFVILSEMVVDWLKHAFITKFNHVRATVYDRFTDVLAKDVLLARGRGKGKERKQPLLLDQSPLVARRLGFASIPLACLVLRVGVQAVGMLHQHAGADVDGISSSLAWDVVKWSAQSGMDAREAADDVNDFGRAGIAESKEEVEYNKQTKEHLSQAHDDLPEYTPMSVASSSVPFAKPSPPTLQPKPKAKGKKWHLEEVERWTMVKRIW
ncbi:transmembrane anterior posterior transformation protein 1, partial [Tremellales sp. Uapishka_1]